MALSFEKAMEQNLLSDSEIKRLAATVLASAEDFKVGLTSSTQLPNQTLTRLATAGSPPRRRRLRRQTRPLRQFLVRHAQEAS